MYEVKDFTIQIIFADGEEMDFDYENFTLAEAMEAAFKDAKGGSNGVLVDSIEIAVLET